MKIDKKKAESLLRAAVRRRGKDTVIVDCYYEVNNKPQCIIGEALAPVIDAPLADVFSERTNDANQWNLNSTKFSEIVDTLSENTGIQFTDGAAVLLNNAQELQDNSMSWGETLDKVLRKR